MSQELKEVLKLARKLWDEGYVERTWISQSSPYICDNIGRADFELTSLECEDVGHVYAFIREQIEGKWDVPSFLDLSTDFWNGNWREDNKIQAVIDFRIQLWDKIFAEFGVDNA